MKMEITAKNYSTPDRLMRILKMKLDKLDKYFDNEIKAKVFLKCEKSEIHTMEITLITNGTNVRSEVFSENMYDNIDLILPKLERQLIKHRRKFVAINKKNYLEEQDFLFNAYIEDKKSDEVVRSKKFELTPMSVEQAQEEMDLLSHNFYVFLNADTNEVNVVYRRINGNLGLIETTKAAK